MQVQFLLLIMYIRILFLNWLFIRFTILLQSVITEVGIVHIYQSLEIMHFYNFASILIILDYGVNSFLFHTVLCQKLLDVLVVEQILLN